MLIMNMMAIYFENVHDSRPTPSILIPTLTFIPSPFEKFHNYLVNRESIWKSKIETNLSSRTYSESHWLLFAERLELMVTFSKIRVLADEMQAFCEIFD